MIQSNFTHNGRGIAIDGEGSYNFCNDYARNLAIFGVDNWKTNILVWVQQKNNCTGAAVW